MITRPLRLLSVFGILAASMLVLLTLAACDADGQATSAPEPMHTNPVITDTSEVMAAPGVVVADVQNDQSVPNITSNPVSETARTADPLPSPLPFDVEPDNDVDAETGEPLANAWASTQNPAVGSDAATASPGLPAPLDPSVAPDNDVIVE